MVHNKFFDNSSKFLINIIKFIGISGVGWLIDFFLFNILSIYLSTYKSNFISSVVGVSFVFITSTKTIFENKSRIGLHTKYAIYVIYQLIIISIISFFISKISYSLMSCDFGILIKFANQVSKILVTPISMMINFIFLKLLIERI